MAGAFQGLLHTGHALIRIHKTSGELLKRSLGRLLVPQILRQRLQAFFARDGRFGAALGFVREVEVFKFVFLQHRFDPRAQFRRQLALLVDGLEHRGAPFFELAKILRLLLDGADLDFVQVLRDLLAVASDEGHRRPFIEQFHCGHQALERDRKLLHDPEQRGSRQGVQLLHETDFHFSGPPNCYSYPMIKFAILVVAALPLLAQLPAPNAAGVANGHEHLRVRDVEAQKRFWVEALGAQASKLGNVEMLKLPGTVILIQAADTSQGMKGSVVDHLAFKVRDLKSALDRAKSAGATYAQHSPTSAMVTAPEGIELELMEDRSIASAAVHHHIHFHTAQVAEMKAWYVKTFSAVPGRRGKIEAADLPGVNLSFDPDKPGLAPTKGRTLDHIGFEVKNLEAFSKRLEAQGVKFDVPYRMVPAFGVAIAFLTDPWGTYIELTEGLDKI